MDINASLYPNTSDVSKEVNDIKVILNVILGKFNALTTKLSGSSSATNPAASKSKTQENDTFDLDEFSKLLSEVVAEKQKDIRASYREEKRIEPESEKASTDKCVPPVPPTNEEEQIKPESELPKAGPDGWRTLRGLITTIHEEEQRIDPESGKKYSWSEFRRTHSRTYSEEEVVDYWSKACKPLQPTIEEQRMESETLPPTNELEQQVEPESGKADTCKQEPSTSEEDQRIEPESVPPINEEEQRIEPQSGLPTIKEEERIEPESGRKYTWNDFEVEFSKSYSETEVQDYWTNSCKPVPPTIEEEEKVEPIKEEEKIEPESAPPANEEDLLIKFGKAFTKPVSPTIEATIEEDQRIGDSVADHMPKGRSAVVVERIEPEALHANDDEQTMEPESEKPFPLSDFELSKTEGGKGKGLEIERLRLLKGKSKGKEMLGSPAVHTQKGKEPPSVHTQKGKEPPSVHTQKGKELLLKGKGKDFGKAMKGKGKPSVIQQGQKLKVFVEYEDRHRLEEIFYNFCFPNGIPQEKVSAYTAGGILLAGDEDPREDEDAWPISFVYDPTAAPSFRGTSLLSVDSWE